VTFLLDENLAPRICNPLNAAGYDAVHVRDEGMSGASDPDVLARAVSGDRVLVTADRADFGRVLAFTQAARPSVVLLRQLPAVVRAQHVAALGLANLTPQLVAALEKGAFVVLTPQAARLRYLPLR